MRDGTERVAEMRERVQGLGQNIARRSSNIDRSGVEFEARQVGVWARGREREKTGERERETGEESLTGSSLHGEAGEGHK